jgi:hypothetical protein
MRRWVDRSLGMRANRFCTRLQNTETGIPVALATFAQERNAGTEAGSALHKSRMSVVKDLWKPFLAFVLRVNPPLQGEPSGRNNYGCRTEASEDGGHHDCKMVLLQHVNPQS